MNQDYPAEEQLNAIRKADMFENDLPAMVELIEDAWNHTYGKMIFNDGVLSLATGGWSGNEDVMGALNDNETFWRLYWWKSERGGRFWFKPMFKPTKTSPQKG